jgi:quercetin dioxygenase-like cupin family protein
MDAKPLIVAPNDYARALDVVGMKITVLASNAVTKGYEITIQEGDEGTGPPPHSHDWDEAFFVLEGTVEFSCGGEALSCAPGTLVHLPSGTVHAFCFGAGGGKMLEMTGAGSQASQMFKAIDQEVPPGPPDIPKLVEVLRTNGVTLAE